MSNVVRVFSVNENERETLKFETPFFHWRARYNPFDDSKTLKTENLTRKFKNKRKSNVYCAIFVENSIFRQFKQEILAENWIFGRFLDPRN